MHGNKLVETKAEFKEEELGAVIGKVIGILGY